MKYYSCFIVCILLAVKIFSQHVGVGTTTPAEKLDVNGNINVTGTIKVNGVDGTPHQVLMKNGSGAMSWGDLCDYKNFEMFNDPGVHSWVVPAGVTKVGVEIWGGGGGGSLYCGGGGGAYVRGYFNVVPGEIVYIAVGGGGSGGGAPSNGGTSEAVYGSIGLGAFGGAAGGFNVNAISIGDGGHGSATAGYRNYFAINGAPGQLATSRYTSTSTNNLELTEGGLGGNAGNTTNTGGTGAYRVIVASSGMTLRNAIGEAGRVPGGGGGAGFNLIQTTVTGTGQAGGNGMGIIHY